MYTRCWDLPLLPALRHKPKHFQFDAGASIFGLERTVLQKNRQKTREGYENAWKTLRMLEHLEMLDITVHDYQAAMDKLTRKSRSLQNKLLLLIGQLCNYATEVHRMEVVKPSSYLVLDGIESKSP